jgi:hypothetical protein
MTTFRLRVRHRGRVASLSGIEVERVEQAAIVSRVPGSPLGMALVRGQIIPVLRLGDEEGCLVVGHVQGELLGVIGLHIVGLVPEDSGIEPSAPMTAPNPSGIDAPEMGLAMNGDWPLPTADSISSSAELDIAALVAAATFRRHDVAQSPEVTI